MRTGSIAAFIVAGGFVATTGSYGAEVYRIGQRVNLADVGGSVPGIKITGRNQNDHCGYAIASGDFNGDGERDLLIGAEWAPNNARKGEVYLIYGPQNVSKELKLRLDNQAVRFVGEYGRWRGTAPGGVVDSSPGDRAGSAVEMFDFNGDGYDDIIIGAIAYDSYTNDNCDVSQCNLVSTCPCNPYNQSGRVYIIFGRPDVLGVRPFIGQGQEHFLADVGGAIEDSIVLKTVGDHHRLGKHLARGGDVDGDGVEDLVVGAQSYSPNSNPVASGAIYILYGWCEGCKTPDARPVNPDPDSFDNENTFRLEDDVLNGVLRGHMFEGTTTGGWMGSCAGVGDMDGDGYGEVIMGEYKRDAGGLEQAGSAFLVFGGPNVPVHVDFIQLVNGNNPSGMRWAVFEGIRTTLDDRPTPPPQQVYEHETGDWAGWWVSAAGDINGDGRQDALIGAPGAGPEIWHNYGCNNCGQPNEELVTWYTTSNVGEVYLIYGSDGIALPSIEGIHNLSEIESGQIAGAVLQGRGILDRLGDSTACAGDFNGDGFDDLVLGASTADPGYAGITQIDLGNAVMVIHSSGVDIKPRVLDPEAGKAYLIPGGHLFGVVNVEDVAVIFQGVGSQVGASNDNAGDAVIGVGDLNGDGYDDIGIGAPGADSDRGNGGDTYIIFGRPVYK